MLWYIDKSTTEVLLERVGGGVGGRSGGGGGRVGVGATGFILL